MATVNTALASSYITPELVAPEFPGIIVTRYNIPASAITIVSSTTSGDVCTVSLGTTPANWAALSCYTVIPTSFNATSMTSIVMTAGTTTNATCFQASTTVTGAAYSTIINTGGLMSVNTIANAQATASLTTQVSFTIQGAAGFNAMTTGFLQVVLAIKDLSATY